MNKQFLINEQRVIAVFVLAFLAVTFFVAKEVYDPHIGVKDDIFCKSLDAVGEKISSAVVCFLGEFYTEKIRVFVSLYHGVIIPCRFMSRAPPVT